LNCEVCGAPYAEEHHIVSKRAAGRARDIPENKIWLCADHHTMGPDAVHNIGWISFARKFGLTERFERAREAVWKVLNGQEEERRTANTIPSSL
jgi:hypothetical protein